MVAISFHLDTFPSFRLIALFVILCHWTWISAFDQLDMAGRYFLARLLLICAVFRMVFPGHLTILSCQPGDKPVEKIERVNKGADANLRVTMYGSCGAYLNAGYAWSHEDGDKIVEVVEIGTRSLGSTLQCCQGQVQYENTNRLQ